MKAFIIQIVIKALQTIALFSLTGIFYDAAEISPMPTLVRILISGVCNKTTIFT
jgi:hypothetical protein